MADNSTIGVDLGGVITTSGGVNTAALQALADFITSHNYVFESLSKAQLPAPANVFFTLTDDPTITLPANSPGFNTGGFNATVTGGGPDTALIASGGNVQYSGAAGHIFANNGSGSFTDTASAASIAATDGTYVVVASGADSLVLGGAAASVTASSGGATAATLEGGVQYTAGNADTIVATAGLSTVTGATGDLYVGNAASVLFFAVGTASTVVGGSGSDTVYGNATTYIAGNGSNVFAGGATASTVYGGASGADTVQAGSAGDLVYLKGSADRVVSGGGKDTIWGSSPGSGVAPTIFGMTNSYELLVSDMKGGLIIGLGDNTTLDGANTDGGLNFFANPGLGNQTFIGSATGSSDTYYVGAQNVGTSLITIQNWHAGDSLNLSAFGAADQANAAKVFAAGQGLLKLSDGTTVVFSGAHPTSGNGGFYS